MLGPSLRMQKKLEYPPGMLTNRDMVNFQKWDFFRFFFILLL